MDNIDHFLMGLPVSLFWAAVISFLPNAIYLMTHPLESYRAEKARQKKIFILYQESRLEAEKKDRLRMMGMIFLICLALSVCLYIFNWVRNGRPGLYPLDIISAVLIICFWISVLGYIPVLFYFMLVRPWKLKEEGIFLKKILFIYGALMLVFSLFYASDWLTRQNILSSASEFVSACVVVFYATSILAYLPILFYILPRASHKHGGQISLYTVFVIYCCCFLAFTLIYSIEWIHNKRAGYEYIPWTKIINSKK